MLAGDFSSRIGKACNPNENIWATWGGTKKMNGAEMLKFIKNNEMETLKDRVKTPSPEW